MRFDDVMMVSFLEIYEPQEDSFLLEKWVNLRAYGKVLDLGTGSGIQAIAASELSRVTSVLAIDYNNNAITKLNRKMIPKIRCQKSDIFSNIERTTRFDTIICNPPYLPQDKGIVDPTIYGGKHGYEYVEKVIHAMGDFLSNDGRLLLLISSLTKPRIVEKLLTDHLFDFKVLETMHISFEDLIVYEITKSSIRKDLEAINLSDIIPLAVGRHSNVLLASLGKNRVVIKLAKPHAKGVIIKEGHWLSMVNRKGIGPKLLFKTPHAVIMEYVGGIPILEVLEKSCKHSIQLIFKEFLRQCRILDEMGISKEELHRPYKHAIIANTTTLTRNESNRVNMTMIDFERCHPSNRPNNVTQGCQFLQWEKVKVILANKNLAVMDPLLRTFAQQYHVDQSTANFEKIVHVATHLITQFQYQVYQSCSAIPKGKTASYKDIALALHTKAFRAVGSALNKNHFAPDVPCHRVIAHDGSIGGFATGVKHKKRLLDSEMEL